MGWCLVPFVMLKFHKYWHMYSTVYYMGFIVFLLWPLYKQLVKLIIVDNRTEAVGSKDRIDTAASTQRSKED